MDDNGKSDHKLPDREVGAKFRQPVTVDLTTQERAAKSTEMVNLEMRIEDVEQERRNATSGYREQLQALRKSKKEIVTALFTGKETRDVEQQEVYDFQHNRVQVTRVDTGEVINHRAMTADERQRLLDFDNEENAKAAKKRGGKKKAGGKSASAHR